jgi:flavin-dependent dehydrogenase
VIDVVIAGAGPAGSIAALILARAGARVVIVDRDEFPRDKLCGDTLNPGAVAMLRSLDLGGGPLDRARSLEGMLVTGPGAAVSATYGGGRAGLALRRRDLDAWLLERAVAAGARFEGGVTVRGPLVEAPGQSHVVRGLVLAPRGGAAQPLRLPALLTIAADGRRSVVARALGLARHPAHPRRWAFGTYVSGVAGLTAMGEMHIRRGFYLGVAPLSPEVANVCVVTGPRPDGRTPIDVIQRAIGRDASLKERFAGARFDAPVAVLGPLAIDTTAAGAPGVLLAGDAAGFIDPMTGDGLHLAIRSAAMAAAEAQAALERGTFGAAAEELARALRRQLGAKLRFNRILRAVSGSPGAVRVAARSARLAPGFVRRAIQYSGDVG